MRRYFIDTNVFLNTLIQRDKKSFIDCCQFLDNIKSNKFKAVTSNVVLAELVWVLKSFYGFSREKISRGLKSIVKLKGLRLIDNYQLLKAIEMYESKSVKYIDALIASIKPIFEKKWIIVSYDKDFDKLKVKRVEPGEL